MLEVMAMWLALMIPALLVLTVAAWLADTPTGERIAQRVDAWMQERGWM